jgi:hypothetical protein
MAEVIKSRMSRKAEQEKRQTEAKERQEAYNKLTVEQKLAKLDKGNFTATRQRAKLKKQLTKA